MKNGKFWFVVKICAMSISLVLVGCTTTPPAITPTNEPIASPNTIVTTTEPATPTLWPTQPPLPTIAPHQTGQAYIELMNNNGGCKLPCWWGFHLGNVTIDKVKQIYMSLGADIYEQKYTDGYSVLEALFIDSQIEDGTQLRHMFLAQDGIVIEVEAQVRRQPNYQIEPLLQQLGQPSEIWMWTIPESYEGILPASFRLYYPEQGVLIAYVVEGERVDDTVQVCFNELGSVILGLWEPSIWDPNGTKGLVERANETSELGLYTGSYPIGEVSNWGVEEFYTILTAPSHSECLETPSNLWRSP